jgi:hypothetical protein
MKLGDISTIAQHSNSVHAADVKSAALGTDDEDAARALLLRAGVSGLQRAAGYLPDKMIPDDKKVPSIFVGYKEARVWQEFWPELFNREFDSGITNAKWLLNFWQAFDSALKLWRAHPQWERLTDSEERFRVIWRLFCNRAEIKARNATSKLSVAGLILNVCKGEMLHEYNTVGTMDMDDNPTGYAAFWQTLEQIVHGWVN